MQIVIFCLGFVNVVAFLIYGLDKQKARQNRWRIPERVLLGLAVLGGSVGALAAMWMFHHKTKKMKFKIGVPVILFLQYAAIVYLKFFFVFE